MKTLLWLDDIRNPESGNWLNYSPIHPPFKIIWAKNYQEFTDWINQNGLPDGICFDHDLEPDEIDGDILDLKNAKIKFAKTGYDCAKWLVDYCLDNNKMLPLFNIQSANPSGKENISSLLNNFKKYKK